MMRSDMLTCLRSFPLASGLIFLIILGLLAVPLSIRPLDLPRVEQVGSASELQKFYVTLDYSLASARRGLPVPRVTISDIPADWGSDLEPNARKRVFFESVLPLVLLINETMYADRQRLRHIDTRRRGGAAWRTADRRWLNDRARRYDIAPADDSADPDEHYGRILAELTHRIGPVPPSLALAQAAVESGYGTSRFAIAGNALFGQWTTSKGLKPQQQRANKTAFNIAAFRTPLQSVDAYVRNLNMHRAYREFRVKRQRMEDATVTLDGATLAATLSAYSEKGTTYTEMLRRIIRVNGLAALDRATLETGRPIRLLVH